MIINPAENELLERLKAFGADVYAGTYRSLRDRIGTTIRRHRVEDVPIERSEGVVDTFAQAFSRAYGRKL